MANLRNLKKQIDYALEAFVFDCDAAIYAHPEKGNEIFVMMQEAVELRNELFVKAVNPTEPKNKSLVKKYYTALYAEINEKFEALFNKLSAAIE